MLQLPPSSAQAEQRREKNQQELEKEGYKEKKKSPRSAIQPVSGLRRTPLRSAYLHFSIAGEARPFLIFRRSILPAEKASTQPPTSILSSLEYPYPPEVARCVQRCTARGHLAISRCPLVVPIHPRIARQRTAPPFLNVICKAQPKLQLFKRRTAN